MEMHGSLETIYRTPPPERLYKYTSFRRAEEILLNNSVYFAKPSEFNDPFDGRFSLNLETPKAKMDFIKFVEEGSVKYMTPLPSDWELKKQSLMTNQRCANQIAMEIIRVCEKQDNTGFCCLSGVRDSLLMWGHYARSHTGCCFVFDLSCHWTHEHDAVKDCFPFTFISKINYSHHLFDYPKQGNLHAHYLCKSSQWKYEQEWRAVMDDSRILDESDRNAPWSQRFRGAGYYKLDAGLLVGVILGYRMSPGNKNNIGRLARQRGIKIYQAAPKLYEYGLDIN